MSEPGSGSRVGGGRAVLPTTETGGAGTVAVGFTNKILFLVSSPEGTVLCRGMLTFLPGNTLRIGLGRVYPDVAPPNDLTLEQNPTVTIFFKPIHPYKERPPDKEHSLIDYAEIETQYYSESFGKITSIPESKQFFVGRADASLVVTPEKLQWIIQTVTGMATKSLLEKIDGAQQLLAKLSGVQKAAASLEEITSAIQQEEKVRENTDQLRHDLSNFQKLIDGLDSSTISDMATEKGNHVGGVFLTTGAPFQEAQRDSSSGGGSLTT